MGYFHCNSSTAAHLDTVIIIIFIFWVFGRHFVLSSMQLFKPHTWTQMLIVIFLDCNSCSRTFGLHAHLDPLEYKGIILDVYIFSHFKIFSPKYNGGGVENTQACGHQLPWELCYVQGRAPQNSGQRPHKLCPTHSTVKKGGFRKEFRA